MNSFYDERDNERRARATGWISVVAYVAAMVALLMLVRTSQKDDLVGNEGVMIALGDTFEAGGDAMAAMEQPAPEEEQEMLTQNHEDAPEVPSRPRTETPPRPTPEPVRVPERRPDPNALFPGRSSSHGVSQGEGRQGASYGSPDGSPTGTGTGTSGDGYDLSGRRLQGAFPKPNYASNKSGRVVVDITVDSQGRVTRAVFRPQGSTTTDNALVTAAIAAARRAQFDIIEGSPDQRGTITYNFRLR